MPQGSGCANDQAGPAIHDTKRDARQYEGVGQYEDFPAIGGNLTEGKLEMGVYSEMTSAGTVLLLATFACGGRTEMSSLNDGDSVAFESTGGNLGMGGSVETPTSSYPGMGGAGWTTTSSYPGTGGTERTSRVNTLGQGVTSQTSIRTDPRSGPWIFFDSLHNSNRSIYAIRDDGSGLYPC